MAESGFNDIGVAKLYTILNTNLVLFILNDDNLSSLRSFSHHGNRRLHYNFRSVKNKVMDNDSIKENIRYFRTLKHLTQAEVADKLEISRDSYRNIESGNSRIISSHADKIARALGVSIEMLFLGYQPASKDECTRLQEVKDNAYTTSKAIEEDYVLRMQALQKKIEEKDEMIEFLRGRVRDKEELIELYKGRIYEETLKKQQSSNPTE